MTMGFGPMSSCPKFTVSDAFLVTEVEFAMAAVMTPQFFYCGPRLSGLGTSQIGEDSLSSFFWDLNYSLCFFQAYVH